MRRERGGIIVENLIKCKATTVVDLSFYFLSSPELCDSRWPLSLIRCWDYGVSEVHKQEPTTPILGLCSEIFTNQATFRRVRFGLHEQPISIPWVIERVSIECRKTKTKVITLANQKGRRQSSKPIKTRSNYTCRQEVREHVHARATIGFGFTSDWLKKWHENFEPITE